MHARIGRVDEWTVRARLVDGTLSTPSGWDAPATLRRWVSLEERRGDLFARMDTAVLQLHFTRRSEQVRVRSQVGTWSRPFVCYLEISGDARGQLEGTLVVMRTALPGALDAEPSIVLPPERLQELAESERPRLAELAEEAVLPSGEGPVMIVQTPLLLGAAEQGAPPKVIVHLHRRWRLDCDVMGEPGAQHLLVREVLRSGSPAIIPDGRLVACPRAPRLVATLAEACGADLGPLLPQRHPMLEAWIAYEELVQDRRLYSFEVRRAHPLEYTEVASVSADSTPLFRVELALPQEAHEYWLDPSARQRRKMRVRVAAELVDLDEQEDPSPCEIVSFDSPGGGGLCATIRLSRAGGVPPVRGRLLAVEDEGEVRQRERRKRALDRLRSGTSANPELLGWLMNPASVPDADPGPRAPSGLTGLDENQRRAVALATRVPSIVLVLGPPGSGKTTVIRAIVDELKKRAERAHASNDAPSPFRVLVTSIQNEAVDNVAEKVGGTAGIEIWHIGDRAARAARAASLARDAQRIAAELWKELRDAPRFIAYQRLHRLRDTVAVLRHAFFEIGIGPEIAERLRTLASADERRALTPLLGEQIEGLVERLARALVESQPAGPTAGEPEGGLVAVLRRLAQRSEALTMEVWPTLAIELDAVSTALAAPGPADGRWVDLGERWNDLRRRLRRAATTGFTGDLADALEALRGETAGDLVAAARYDPQPSAHRGPPAELVAEVHGWVQRATSLVEQQLSQYAQQEEAVLYHWIHTLAEEPSRLERIVERHAMVTAATCQRVDQGRRDAPPSEYDVVIVDEAARAGIDVLVPMTLGKSIVLVGDHRQLPPHVEKDLADRLDEGIREEIDLERESLFSWLWKRLPRGNLVSLSRQYRMHEDIGRAVSRLFYEPEITLSHHYADERAAARRPDFGLCSNEPLVWIDTSDVLRDPVLRLNERVESWPCAERNEYEARLIVRMLRRIERGSLVAWSAKEGRTPVGVIAFYGEQVALLQALLAADLDPELHALVQVGSVDSFQGREFPLVILSAVRSNQDGFVGFLRLPNRINVAMSRAQRQLILIGDGRTLAARGNAGSPSFQRLFEDLSSKRSRGLLLKSAEVVQ